METELHFTVMNHFKFFFGISDLSWLNEICEVCVISIIYDDM